MAIPTSPARRPSSNEWVYQPQTSRTRPDHMLRLPPATNDYRSLDENTVGAVASPPASVTQAAMVHLQYAGYVPQNQLPPQMYGRSLSSQQQTIEREQSDARPSRGMPSKSPSSKWSINNNNNNSYRGMLEDESAHKKGRNQSAMVDSDIDDEVYIVRQNHGYCSYLFSFVQITILILMMWQCGIAPLKINPMIGPYPDALSEWGGKNTVLILEDNQWWRLFTPILLHAGVIHLLCNVAVQLDTGAFFEKEWGSVRWLVIYLSSAVGSSVLSCIVMPDAVSVGSSGAVMGLFGAKLSEVVMRVCEHSDTPQAVVSHQVRKEQCVGVTCSVMIVMLFSFIPYVDWAAHLGGLVAGMLVGVFIFAREGIESLCWRAFWVLTGLGATIACFTVAIQYLYSGEIQATEELRDVCGYYMANFPDYECNCMVAEYKANGGNGNQ